MLCICVYSYPRFLYKSINITFICTSNSARVLIKYLVRQFFSSVNLYLGIKQLAYFCVVLEMPLNPQHYDILF